MPFIDNIFICLHISPTHSLSFHSPSILGNKGKETEIWKAKDLGREKGKEGKVNWRNLGSSGMQKKNDEEDDWA